MGAGYEEDAWEIKVVLVLKLDRRGGGGIRVDRKFSTHPR